MDNKNVSTIGIGEGIDYLEKEFIGKLDENVNQILASYMSLGAGTLSSANIDQLVSEIRGKITELQNSFDSLASQLRTNMTQSSEAIATSRSNIENTLDQ